MQAIWKGSLWMAGIPPHLILFAFSAFPGKPFLNLGIGGIGAKSVHTADCQPWNRLRINQWEEGNVRRESQGSSSTDQRKVA